MFAEERKTTADMLAAIKAIREDAAERGDQLPSASPIVTRRVRASTQPRTERLAARLLIEQAVAAIGWAAWAERAVLEWPTPTAEDAEWDRCITRCR